MSARPAMKQITIVAILVTAAMLCPTDLAIAQASQQGTAHYYSDKMQGKKTTSGELYDKAALTASHKTLGYGTKVKVTNLANNKSVVVTINDRMATSSKAVIDVSRHAAEELDFIKAGSAKVTLEVQK